MPTSYDARQTQKNIELGMRVFKNGLPARIIHIERTWRRFVGTVVWVDILYDEPRNSKGWQKEMCNVEDLTFGESSIVL